MTSHDLVVALARTCRQSQDIVRDQLEALADLVEDELTAGRPVTLPRIGSFRPMTKPTAAGPKQRVAWHADSGLSAALRTTAGAPGGRGAGEQGSRKPGERKGWRPAANLNGEPVSRSPRK